MKVLGIGRRNLLIITAVVIVISMTALLLYWRISPKQNPTLMTRGSDYQIVDNHDGTYTWSTEPQWVSNGTGYVPYIFEDRRTADGYYQVRTGLIGGRMYDGYIQLLKPDLSSVNVQSEQWFLQHFDNDKWENATLSNLRWNIIKSDQYVEITKSWDTSYLSATGILEITYRFGENLKHIIRWQNTSATWLEPRFIQSWEGINGASVDKLTDSKTGKDVTFTIRDASGNIAVIEDQTSAIDMLSHSSVDMTGKTASFIFSGFDLNKPIEIDPTTTTLQPSSKDDFPYANEATLNHGTSTAVFVYTYTNPARSLLTFDISSIPATASISLANLSLYWFSSIGSPSGRTYWMYQQTHRDWVETESTWQVYKTGTSWTSAGGDYSVTNGASTVMPSSGGWVNWTVTALVQSFVNSGYTTADFLLKDSSEDGSTAGTYFYSNNYAVDTTKRPKLVITYTIPPQWRNQGTNDTDNTIYNGTSINLTAQGYDTDALDWAILSTNETGQWANKTGAYSSPMDMNNAVATWTWSNFTWSNSSVSSGVVGWKIYYNNTAGSTNVTNTMTFSITIPDLTHPKWYNNAANSTSGGVTLFSANWTDNSALNNSGGYVFSLDNGTGTFVNDSFIYFGEISQNSTDWKNGLVGLWHMNDGTGNAADSSSNGKTGTITGATWTINSSCRFGSCLAFDGNDVVSVTTYNFAPTGTFAISGWAKTSVTSEIWILGQGDDTTNTNEFGIGVESYNNHFRVAIDRNAGSWYYAEGTSTITNNNWHFFTLVYNNRDVKLYVDGNQEATTTFSDGSATTGNQLFAIGGWSRNDVATASWNGFLDDIAVWNRALSVQEIANLYNNSKYFPTNSWSNVTKTVNTTGTIRWQVYANDSANNWNTTNTFSFGGACTPPATGNWNISACTAALNTTIRGNFTVSGGGTFAIVNGSRLVVNSTS